MKRIVLFIMIALFILLNMVRCKPEPEFYIDGVPYYTYTHCTKGHSETHWTYHYGFWMGKVGWHYGPQSTYICERYKTDTIKIIE